MSLVKISNYRTVLSLLPQLNLKALPLLPAVAAIFLSLDPVSLYAADCQDMQLTKEICRIRTGCISESTPAKTLCAKTQFVSHASIIERKLNANVKGQASNGMAAYLLNNSSDSVSSEPSGFQRKIATGVGEDATMAEQREIRARIAAALYSLQSSNTGLEEALALSAADVLQNAQLLKRRNQVLADFRSLADRVRSITSRAELLKLRDDPLAIRYGLSKYLSRVPMKDSALNDVLFSSTKGLENGGQSSLNLVASLTSNTPQSKELWNVVDILTGINRHTDFNKMLDEPRARLSHEGRSLVEFIRHSGTDAKAIEAHLRDGLKRTAIESKKVIEAAKDFRKWSRLQHEQQQFTTFDDVVRAQKVLVNLSHLIKDRDLDSVANGLSDALKVYRAVKSLTALAGSASGGSFGLLAAFDQTTGVTSVLAPSSETDVTTKILSEMFDFLKTQFAVMNAKLDEIITIVKDVDTKLDKVIIELHNVGLIVRSIDERLSHMYTRLNDLGRQVSQFISEEKVRQCRFRMAGGPDGDLGKDAFLECLAVFSSLALNSFKTPFAGCEFNADGATILESLVKYSRADSLDLSGSGCNIARMSASELGIEPTHVVDIPDFPMLARGVEYLLLAQERRPDLVNLPDVKPLLESDINKLTLLTRKAEQMLRDIAGPDKEKRLTRFKTLTEKSYFPILNEAGVIAQKLHELHRHELLMKYIQVSAIRTTKSNELQGYSQDQINAGLDVKSRHGRYIVDNCPGTDWRGSTVPFMKNWNQSSNVEMAMLQFLSDPKPELAIGAREYKYVSPYICFQIDDFRITDPNPSISTMVWAKGKVNLVNVAGLEISVPFKIDNEYINQIPPHIKYEKRFEYVLGTVITPKFEQFISQMLAREDVKRALTNMIINSLQNPAAPLTSYKRFVELTSPNLRLEQLKDNDALIKQNSEQIAKKRSLLRSYLVLFLPDVWSRSDGLRLLFDGKDTQEIPAMTLLTDWLKDRKYVGCGLDPWTPDPSAEMMQVNSVLRAKLGACQARLLATIDEAEGEFAQADGFHPLLFFSVAQLQAASRLIGLQHIDPTTN